MSGAVQFARSRRRRFVQELRDFVRIPSVSSEPRRAADVQLAAQWLATRLRKIGIENVRMLRTARHPIVYGDWRHRADAPTVLVYGHYDVQPAEPGSAWTRPPFEAVVEKGWLYGRGASDDKGPLLCHLNALESYLATEQSLPVNVRCVFEGEEEIGSPGLLRLIQRHSRAFAATVSVISDTRMAGPGRPALTYGLRGHLGFELEVRGPRTDLHSGSFGGAVLNPAQALSEIIAALHDRCGRVAIPGFYDRVLPASTSGPPDDEVLRQAGVREGWGEPGYSLHERTTVRPALSVNGLAAGHQGPGGKGVIPARASAKLSFRLVPDQEPEQIERLLRAYLTRLSRPGIEVKLAVQRGCRPVLVARDHPAVAGASVACRAAFGASPMFLRSGGSIPVVSSFQSTLGAVPILMGFSLAEDRAHGPDERFLLDNYFRGTEACIHFLAQMAKLARPSSSTATAMPAGAIG